MQRILRSEARRQGLKRYFTGKPCKQKHVSERNVGSGKCLACERRRENLRRMSDPDAARKKSREKKLKHYYGITSEEYNAMFEKQEHRCACCRDLVKNPHVDHDHDTAKVRGLLCINCNSMLGYALDNPKRLELGIKYLEGS